MEQEVYVVAAMRLKDFKDIEENILVDTRQININMTNKTMTHEQKISFIADNYNRGLSDSITTFKDELK